MIDCMHASSHIIISSCNTKQSHKKIQHQEEDKTKQRHQHHNTIHAIYKHTHTLSLSHTHTHTHTLTIIMMMNKNINNNEQHGNSNSNSNSHSHQRKKSHNIPPQVKEIIWHPPQPTSNMEEPQDDDSKHRRKRTQRRRTTHCKYTPLHLTLLLFAIMLSMISFLYLASKTSRKNKNMTKRQKESTNGIYTSSTTSNVNKVTEEKEELYHDNDEDTLECRKMRQYVEQHNIELVAIDFDKTIVDIHTGGRWKHSPKRLSKHVRPSFRCFLSYCLFQRQRSQQRSQKQKKRRIPVIAIATFSEQTKLIQQVLQMVLLERGGGDTAAVEQMTTIIPVFGGGAEEEIQQGYEKGKQSQLFLAMKHFNHERQKLKTLTKADDDDEAIAIATTSSTNTTTAIITPSKTLLIDDDENNIQIAQQDGYQTILYRPHKLAIEQPQQISNKKGNGAPNGRELKKKVAQLR